MVDWNITEFDYYKARENLLHSKQLLFLEQQYTNFLQQVVTDVATRIYLDFSNATLLMPFWKNYPPKQRGRAPTGTGIPWSEVAQTSISSNIIRSLSYKDANITYPGLPSGADIRFMTDEVLIHFDVKITGPNDREDEVVASPNQVSGDGAEWKDGVLNSSVQVIGERATMTFQPELPPFYIIEGEIVPCLTYFLKGVYTVESLGHQPLTKMELICVPNGLLMFDGQNYSQIRGLLIPGKDELSHLKKRVRIRMKPLSDLASWRRVVVWQ